MQTTQRPPERSYLEQTFHGDNRMPMRQYHCLIPESFRNLAPHWHEEMEVGMIMDGCGIYRIHKEEYPVQQGDLIILPPRCLHAILQDDDFTMVSDSLVFHLDYLGLQTMDDCTMHHLQPLGTENCIVTPVIHPENPGYWPIYRRLISAMDLYMNQTPFYEITLKADLLLLIGELYRWGYIRNENPSAYQSEAEEKLRNVLSFIQDHFSDHITIHQLAEICGFSDSHFMYFFRTYTGVTALDYLNQYRLEQAARRLQESNLAISRVANDCGWDNISYFNRLFRRMYGVTPRKYRKLREEAQV